MESLSADREKPGLTVADIHAELPLQKGFRNRALGSFALAEIKIFNRGNERFANAELVIEADGSSIKSVSDPEGVSLLSGRSRGHRQKQSIKIQRIDRQSPRIVWIELQLGERENLSRPLTESQLKLTLIAKQPSGEVLSDSRTLSWRITNCSNLFHKSLNNIGEIRITAIYEAIENGRKADYTLPGRWLFFPVTVYDTKTVEQNICTRHRYRRNRSTGKWYKVCLSQRNVQRTIKTPVPKSEDEKQILAEARTLILYRGADPAFRKDTGNHWVSKKIYVDLKRYLRQESSPALCTGAPQMTEYYQGKFEQVRKRYTELLELKKKAQQLAISKTDSFLKSVKASGKLTRANIILSGNSDISGEISGLLNAVFDLSPDEKLRTQLKEAKSNIAALTAFRSLKSQYEKSLELDQSLVSSLDQALTMIEAVYYLGVGTSKYEQIVSAIDGTLNEILQAHGSRCVCSTSASLEN